MSESTPASRAKLRQILIWGAAVLAVGGGVLGWQRLKPQGLPPSIASGNGRLEATDTDIATKTGGRIKQVLVREGDNVKAGQTLAIMTPLCWKPIWPVHKRRSAKPSKPAPLSMHCWLNANRR